MSDPSSKMRDKAHRLGELEAIRGIASVVVLVHHMLLAFAPKLHGLLNPDSAGTLFGSPAFSLINGSASVVIFFVLSGFVLTFRPMKMGTTRPLFFSALRRWPRLAVPTAASTLISAALMTMGLYASTQAAVLSGSTWLGWFFGSESQGLSTFIAAGQEGAFTIFWTGQSYFNSNLWTMRFELVGSLVAYLCAGIAIHAKCWKWFVPASGLAWIIATAISPYLGSFVVGVVLARAFVTAPDWRLSSGSATAALVVVAVVLLGYHEPFGPGVIASDWYAFLRPIEARDPVLVRVTLHSVGAVIVIALALYHPWLNAKLQRPVFAFLGRFSFPLYLVHTLVICSVGSLIYILLHPVNPVIASVAAMAATVVTSFIMAWPLAVLDEHWLKTLRWRLPRERPPVTAIAQESS